MIHGEDKEEEKNIAHDKITKRVITLHGKREEVEHKYGSLFRKGVASLITRSTQYLVKWAASFRMAENVIARGKLKTAGGGKGGLRGVRRGKGKSKRKGGNRNA